MDTRGLPERRQRQMKISFLDHLIRSIDIMLYCQLSILYYMDCSLFKFLVRAIPHWFHFTPKPDFIPPIPPGQRPYIATIFGTNAFCMLMHAVFAPPSVGEAARGYLHGGWLIDFVGQSSPVSKWRLLIWDGICLGLQLLMLGVTLEKKFTAGLAEPATDARLLRQDHNAEEAGISRANQPTTGDLELQDLSTLHTPQTSTSLTHEPGRNENIGDDDDSCAAPPPSRLDPAPASTPAHPLDTFFSGTHLLADVNLVNMVKTQWRLRNSSIAAAATAAAATTTTSSRSMPSSTAVARQRLRMAFGNR